MEISNGMPPDRLCPSVGSSPGAAPTAATASKPRGSLIWNQRHLMSVLREYGDFYN
jgi:hypothetical protein